MLIWNKPIQLHSIRPVKMGSDLLSQKITANYRFFYCRLDAQELLHLASLPPELMIAEGGGGNLFHQDIYRNTEMQMEWISQFINRIILDGSLYLSYQDQVFIGTVLNRVGIREQENFMRQFRLLQKETRLQQKLSYFYWREEKSLLKMAERYETVAGSDGHAGEDGEKRLEEERNFLYHHIFSRLKDIENCEQVYAFHHRLPSEEGKVRYQEAWLLENRRKTENLILTRVREEIYRKPGRVTVVPGYNLFTDSHTGGDSARTGLTEKKILTQISGTILLHLADIACNVRKEQINQTYLELKQAISKSAETVLRYFEAQSNLTQDIREQRVSLSQYEMKLLEQSLTVNREVSAVFTRDTPDPVRDELIYMRQDVWEEKAAEVPSDLVRVIKYMEKLTEIQNKEMVQAGAETANEMPEIKQYLHFLDEEPIEVWNRKDKPVIAAGLISQDAPVPESKGRTEKLEEQISFYSREELDRIDQKNKAMYEQWTQKTETEDTAALILPDKKAIMQNALRALEHPEEVLREAFEYRNAPEITPDKMEIMKYLSLADEKTRFFYEKILEEKTKEASFTEQEMEHQKRDLPSQDVIRDILQFAGPDKETFDVENKRPVSAEPVNRDQEKQMIFREFRERTEYREGKTEQNESKQPLILHPEETVEKLQEQHFEREMHSEQISQEEIISKIAERILQNQPMEQALKKQASVGLKEPEGKPEKEAAMQAELLPPALNLALPEVREDTGAADSEEAVEGLRESVRILHTEQSKESEQLIRETVERYTENVTDSEFILNGETSEAVLIHESTTESKFYPGQEKSITEIWSKKTEEHAVSNQEIHKKTETMREMRSREERNALQKIRRMNISKTDRYHILTLQSGKQKIEPPELIHKEVQNIPEEEELIRMVRQQNSEGEKVLERQFHTEKIKKQEISKITRETIIQNKTLITDIVSGNLQSQIGQLSDKIYHKIEKKLQSERKRRGF